MWRRVRLRTTSVGWKIRSSKEKDAAHRHDNSPTFTTVSDRWLWCCYASYSQSRNGCFAPRGEGRKR